MIPALFTSCVGNPIKDQFTDLPLNKRQRYVARQKARGKCAKCVRKVFKWDMCRFHVKQQREQDNKSYLAKNGGYKRGPYKKVKV